MTLSTARHSHFGSSRLLSRSRFAPVGVSLPRFLPSSPLRVRRRHLLPPLLLCPFLLRLRFLFSVNVGFTLSPLRGGLATPTAYKFLLRMRRQFATLPQIAALAITKNLFDHGGFSQVPAVYAALFKGAPSLQPLLTTLRAVQAMCPMASDDWIIVESLGVWPLAPRCHDPRDFSGMQSLTCSRLRSAKSSSVPHTWPRTTHLN